MRWDIVAEGPPAVRGFPSLPEDQGCGLGNHTQAPRPPGDLPLSAALRRAAAAVAGAADAAQLEFRLHPPYRRRSGAAGQVAYVAVPEIGRASCRERVCQYV